MKILRIEEVIERVKLSRSTLWRMERENKFPKRIRIGSKAMGWNESDIEFWLASRPRGLETFR